MGKEAAKDLISAHRTSREHTNKTTQLAYTNSLPPSPGMWVNTMYINSTKGSPSKCVHAQKVQKHSTFSLKNDNNFQASTFSLN